jgi:sirohydrochlorin ferrochelatase
MEKFGILLLGHGSSLPYNKKLVEETASMLRKKHKITVHTLQDIPAQLGIESGSRKTTIKYDGNNVEIFYAQPLGADPAIAELAYQRAREALEVVK